MQSKRKCQYLLVGDPISWSRAKVCIRNNKPIFYDSQKEIKLRLIIDLERQHIDDYKFQNALKMNVKFYMPIPITRAKKNSPVGKPHFIKPDLDNQIKLICDAIVSSGNILHDDCQFSIINSKKLYDDGKGPRTELTITEL